MTLDLERSIVAMAADNAGPTEIARVLEVDKALVDHVLKCEAQWDLSGEPEDDPYYGHWGSVKLMMADLEKKTTTKTLHTTYKCEVLRMVRELNAIRESLEGTEADREGCPNCDDPAYRNGVCPSCTNPEQAHWDAQHPEPDVGQCPHCGTATKEADANCPECKLPLGVIQAALNLHAFGLHQSINALAVVIDDGGGHPFVDIANKLFDVAKEAEQLEQNEMPGVDFDAAMKEEFERQGRETFQPTAEDNLLNPPAQGPSPKATIWVWHPDVIGNGFIFDEHTYTTKDVEQDFLFMIMVSDDGWFAVDSIGPDGITKDCTVGNPNWQRFAQ